MHDLQSRNVIVGGGAMGAAAAYALAARGEPVLLIEQFALGHDRGSSHGAARIIRHSYADPAYAGLMPAAFRAWRELEAAAAVPLFTRTGGVSLCPPGVDYVARVSACLGQLDVPHRRMAGADWNRANPAFGVPADHDVVFEPDAGMLAAARAVGLQLELARAVGGDRTLVLERTPVRSIDLDGPRPVVLADGVRVTAERLIVAAGAWADRLVPGLGVELAVTRQRVCYLRPEEPTPYRVGRLPAFIAMGAGPLEAFYGMPDFGGTTVKVARHGGLPTDPDLDDRAVTAADAAIVREFLRGCLPGLADAPLAAAETCLYTSTPDERFLVDFLPGRGDVLVASPCSGHGFKFSCLIGRILAEMAVDGASPIRPSAWDLPRAGG
ncbi:Monomeric sarcosine oxidase [Aquisphaera giovannonii]|uniref:Monomeric sarcosine oxidase n=1 Tax=Aquisphaera giovannonii TaxID=406548 RepID=A0A5B9W0L9_9BACT|nr:N-methyl-L-tryptophan oxidase [Aquisphaera giovannonii]QEH34156.1 Monomeric sarcosine oxidase [Aquisphaera giovannonii]